MITPQQPNPTPPSSASSTGDAATDSVVASATAAAGASQAFQPDPTYQSQWGAAENAPAPDFMWDENYDLNILYQMPEEQLARLQQRMERLNLVTSPTLGFVDEKTEKAFSRILRYSNDRQQHWMSTLQTIANMQRGQEQDDLTSDINQTPPDLYRPPNYESMAEGIKGYMRDTLRRDPTEAELALMGDKLGALYRQAFDDTVAGNQMVEDNIGAGRVIEGPAQRDPMAEFRAWAENQYADEIDVVEDVDERQQSTALTGSIADSLGRLVGGAQ